MTTPKRLGFASEDIFEQSGIELINSLRDRNKKALTAFEKEIES